MTRLSKPVSRVTATTVRECGQPREIVATLEPPGLLRVRAKGCRRSYTLPLSVCYAMAVRAQVLAEKKTKRKPLKG